MCLGLPQCGRCTAGQLVDLQIVPGRGGERAASAEVQINLQLVLRTNLKGGLQAGKQRLRPIFVGMNDEAIRLIIPAACDLVAPHLFLQGARHELQRFVTHQVTVAVVDAGQTVHIDEDDAQRQLLAARALEHQPRLLKNRMAQRQAGQLIFGLGRYLVAAEFFAPGHEDGDQLESAQDGRNQGHALIGRGCFHKGLQQRCGQRGVATHQHARGHALAYNKQQIAPGLLARLPWVERQPGQNFCCEPVADGEPGQAHGLGLDQQTHAQNAQQTQHVQRQRQPLVSGAQPVLQRFAQLPDGGHGGAGRQHDEQTIPEQGLLAGRQQDQHPGQRLQQQKMLCMAHG